MSPDAVRLCSKRRDKRGKKLIRHGRPFRVREILLKKRLRRALIQTEKAAAALKRAHVSVPGFSLDAPNQSCVIGIIPWMNRHRRPERDKITGIRVRLRPSVQKIDIELEQKIVLWLDGLLKEKLL